MRLPKCDSPTVLVEITPSVCRAVVPRQPQNNVFPQIKKEDDVSSSFFICAIA